MLWNDKHGIWFDYDLINEKHREYFVPTNLSPLWTGAFNTQDKSLVPRILNYINSTGINQYPGGIPNTLMDTGEQWDFPNVWPPMQYLAIEGLKALNNEEACNMAYSWASRWIHSNFVAYTKNNRSMFEKVSKTAVSLTNLFFFCWYF